MSFKTHVPYQGEGIWEPHPAAAAAAAALDCGAREPNRRRHPTTQAEMKKKTLVASHAESPEQEPIKKTARNILAWALVCMVQKGRRFRGRLKQLIAKSHSRARGRLRPPPQLCYLVCAVPTPSADYTKRRTWYKVVFHVPTGVHSKKYTTHALTRYFTNVTALSFRN